MTKILDKNMVKKKIKKKVLSARLSEIEYQALKKRASDAGVTLSKFARSILLSGKVVQRISKQDADVLRKLSGEANNINQLARVANRDGYKNIAVDMTNLRSKIVLIICLRSCSNLMYNFTSTTHCLASDKKVAFP